MVIDRPPFNAKSDGNGSQTIRQKTIFKSISTEQTQQQFKALKLGIM